MRSSIIDKIGKWIGLFVRFFLLPLSVVVVVQFCICNCLYILNYFTGINLMGMGKSLSVSQKLIVALSNMDKFL